LRLRHFGQSPKQSPAPISGNTRNTTCSNTPTSAFAAFLGLATLHRLSDDLTPEYEVKALPLVFELVEFR